MERSFLENLTLSKEQIESVMEEYGKDVQALRAKVTTLTDKTAEQETALQEYRDIDIEKLQKDAENSRKSLIELKYDHAIEKALAGAKHETLLRGQIDREKLSIDDEGNIKGLTEQVEAVKSTYPDLFTPDVQSGAPENPENKQMSDYESVLKNVDQMSQDELIEYMSN